MRSLKNLFLFITLFASLSVSAQDKLPIKFGKLALQDFDIKSPVIDSNINAVVIANIGKSEFMANTNEGTFSLLFKEKKRIKILNKNGFAAASVIIPLYVSDNNQEKITDLVAVTYNIEDGKVVATKVDKSSVFTEKINDHWIQKKFTFPALKEGSIIEYSYEIKSDFFFNLHTWEFQGEYPVLWSQYEADIPEFYRFLVLKQGYHSFLMDTVTTSNSSFSFQEHVTGTTGSGFNTRRSSTYETYKIDGSIDYHKWIMKDVPALKEEPFTSTLYNSIAKIEFQLQEVAFPRQASVSYMNSWEKTSENLMKNEQFGLLINRPNNWLDDDIAMVVKGAASESEKIKKIYEYVRDNFTCTGYGSHYVTTSLKDVMKNKNGSATDINMLLIAMLRTQNITALPVLLSTRNHGVVNEFYPLMDRYNYLLANAVSEGNNYYLDASVPRLGFNKLPAKVYNGQARIITKETALPLYFSPDSLKEINYTNVFIENGKKGVAAGFISSLKGYLQSLDIRNDIAKSGLEAYIKDLKSNYPEDVELSNVQIDSLKSSDEPVTVKVELKLGDFGDADIVYFNPLLGEAMKKNPFSAAERYYPVEMPYTFNDIYTLNMDIPKGYKIDELPKSVRIKLNEDEGMFEYLISAEESKIQMRCKLEIKRTFFPNEDYQTLRDFFGYIVKKEAEQIVFKKIK